ncbi:MAG: hypothetical protein IJ623_09780 [Bacteroidales bacterium]|nr:hypothetical protein [Bacteroidales bacterium]
MVKFFVAGGVPHYMGDGGIEREVDSSFLMQDAEDTDSDLSLIARPR